MVIANALCYLNMASSLMVNGLCCYYQMAEEDERRKESEAAIQRAIRNELHLHRHTEMVQRQQEQQVKTAVALSQDERRRKLMADKARAAESTKMTGGGGFQPYRVEMRDFSGSSRHYEDSYHVRYCTPYDDNRDTCPAPRSDDAQSLISSSRRTSYSMSSAPPKPVVQHKAISGKSLHLHRNSTISELSSLSSLLDASLHEDDDNDDEGDLMTEILLE